MLNRILIGSNQNPNILMLLSSISRNVGSKFHMLLGTSLCTVFLPPILAPFSFSGSLKWNGALDSCYIRRLFMASNPRMSHFYPHD